MRHPAAGLRLQQTRRKKTGSRSPRCHVEQAGLYSFNAQIRGNGKTVAGIDIPPSINPADARLLWQSQKGFIDTLYIQEGNIVFRNSSGAAGNALIAATDPDGHILWSWHIWNPSPPPTRTDTSFGAGISGIPASKSRN